MKTFLYNIINSFKYQIILKTIYRIAENRNEVISEPNIYKRKKKLIDFLMRKGFENDLIFKTVNDIV